LIFGKETQGLSEALINQYSGQAFRIPLYDSRVRSLNLSNAVSVVVYEAIRQLGS
jgi:tRNA (cytidine/uridine-2'-O-)-methyltransferase